MSSREKSQDKHAEKNFRSAFDRLKSGKTERLPAGSRFSQNNIAREAGCDPSALKKSRYPALILEIQSWANSSPAIASDKKVCSSLISKKSRRALNDQMRDLKEQRDHLASLLLEAQSKIMTLSTELNTLHAAAVHTNVLPIRKMDK